MNERIHARSRSHAALLALTATAAAALAFSPDVAQGGPPAAPPPPSSSSSPQPAVGGATHGALAMDQQLASVEKLQAGKLSGGAPAGIGPAYWAALAPADNRPADARIALGKRLYFEPRLSKDGTVACATCHDVSRGFSDRRATSEGIHDQIGKRNAPTTMNAVFFQTQFLDGRAASLEDQAKLPIVNPIEMGQADGPGVTAAIASDASYQDAFRAAFGRAVNYDDIGRALASYERTLIFLASPFDRFTRGDASAISDDARAGWALFNGKGRCVGCHQMSASNPIGTDNLFHNVGVSARHNDFEQLATRGLEALAKDASKESIDRIALETDLGELGRFVVTRNRSDIGAFKTQAVRNVGVTAPYMHDGSMATLWDVIDHYNKGGEANAYLDGGIEPLALTSREEDQLVAFMFSLTDERLADQNKSEEARQRQVAVQRRPFRDDDMANRKSLPFERRATGGK
jgi:cytochrome c peroxidase